MQINRCFDISLVYYNSSNNVTVEVVVARFFFTFNLIRIMLEIEVLNLLLNKIFQYYICV